MNPPNDNHLGGWNEYQRLVMDRLNSLKTGQEAMATEVSALRTEMAVLKVKAGAWGALAGAIPAGLGLLIHFLFNKRQ